jgi:16S rRNA (guanine1207-N2)-methyltransferase
MSRWLDDPEAAADEVLTRTLDDLQLEGSVLAGYQYGRLPRVLGERGLAVTTWDRHVRAPSKIATSVPPVGPFDAGILRLPKPRQEQAMACNQMLGALIPGAPLVLYGGNDEGIRTAQKMLAGLCGETETIATHGHGRVVRVRRGELGTALKPTLADWRQLATLDLPSGRVPWVSYPGVFADGDLDGGTALLLASLPVIAPEARVLDFGCGPGAIAREILARTPSAKLTLFDNDSVALEAAMENVPGAALMLGDGVNALGTSVFDLIVSNPPLHVGVKEDHRALDGLIATAPKHLSAGGSLVMVVQRRVALDRQLALTFSRVVTAADDGNYRVWVASEPKS